MAFSISSPVISHNGKIPRKYTFEGENISPELIFSNVPPETVSLALIMDDPDAPRGVFTHWIVFNIPKDAAGLSEKIPPIPELPDGSRQGKNDYGSVGYGGPFPPPGKPHHYNFTLYALDTKLNLNAGATKNEVLEAMKGHILEQTTLCGIYQR